MRHSWLLAASFVLVAGLSSPAQAQFLDSLLNRAERAVKGEVGAKVERETRRLTRCAMGDTRCIRTAERNGEEVEIVRSTETPRGTGPTPPASQKEPPSSQGAIIFADEVVSYTFGAGDMPSSAHRRADSALGRPDTDGTDDCNSRDSCPFVLLGEGGRIVLRFTDKVLTGSGDSSPDLWIFGDRTDPDRTVIEISVDGREWVHVGEMQGEQTGVDLDQFGLGRFTAFSYVRLTNVSPSGQRARNRRGAAIDAVGASSTRQVSY